MKLPLEKGLNHFPVQFRPYTMVLSSSPNEPDLIWSIWPCLVRMGRAWPLLDPTLVMWPWTASSSPASLWIQRELPGHLNKIWHVLCPVQYSSTLMCSALRTVQAWPPLTSASPPCASLSVFPQTWESPDSSGIGQRIPGSKPKIHGGQVGNTLLPWWLRWCLLSRWSMKGKPKFKNYYK